MKHPRPSEPVTSLPFTPVIARPLPCSVTPFPNETLGSYTRRLAAANQTTSRTLFTPSRWLRCPLNELELLELLSGQPRTTLVWAIPELRRHAPGIAPAPRTPGVTTRFACRRCIWQSGGAGTVHVHARTHYDNVCVRHGIWHSDGVETLDQQIDLAPAPEVIRAQLTLDRLEQRRGEAFVAECYRQCERVWLALETRGLVRSEVDDLLRRLCEPNTPTGPDPLAPFHRFRRVARFPQLVRFVVWAVSPSLRRVARSAWEAADHVIPAEFERAFPLDHRPRSTTGPWMCDALINLLKRIDSHAQLIPGSGPAT
ncbi:hypothetical protein [Streptomyces abikoensis]|uniref:hypothetical protein n=1 Tax=Streptomyces abikoensis TaxID=97398 RepID=UPI0033F6C82E